MLVKLIVVAALLVASQAHARESSVHLGTRALATTYPGNTAYLDVMEDYGYSRWLAVSWTVGGDHVWRASRRWDLGVHGAYAFGRAERGDDAGFTLHAPEAGVIARLVYRDGDRPSTFGLQLETGIVRPILVLRDERQAGIVPYGRAELVIRPTSTDIALDLRVGWTYARWGEAFGGTGMPLGGVSFAIGAAW